MSEAHAGGAEGRARGALALLAMGLATADLSDISYDKLKQSLRGTLARDPVDSLVVMVLGGSYLFYIAERDANPRVNTYLDSLVFISTCLSVGYDDVFARTEPGKAIATFVMTFGPALAASALDPPPATLLKPEASETSEAPPEPPARAAEEALEVNRAILGRLDEILEALRAPRSL